MSSLFTFRDQVEQAIAADRIGDAIGLMLGVAPFGSGNRRELIAHMSELRRLEREARLGLDLASASQGRRRLVFALAELLDLLIERAGRGGLPVPTMPVKAEVPDQLGLEKIMGTSNLKSIAWLQKGLNCARAVGRIVTPQGLGTGFLVQGGWLVTNHHVIADAASASRSSVDFNYELGIDGNRLEHHSYSLEADSLRTLPEKDLTIVRVRPSDTGPALETWGALALNSAGVPLVGTHVSIIQHPGGGHKQIACTENQIVNIFEYRLQYLTDTLPGSSGAPVFDDDWRVVAVHHAGGNLQSNSKGETRYVNEGILVSALPELGS